MSVLRDMSVDVLENKWTAEEFSAELENNSSQAKFFVVSGCRMENLISCSKKIVREQKK